MIPGVPYDAEIEYLESTGTQWIDTGVKVSDPSAIAIEADETVSQPIGFTHQNKTSGTWIARYAPPSVPSSLYIYYDKYTGRLISTATETRKISIYDGASGYYENGVKVISFIASLGTDSIANHNWIYGGCYDFNSNSVDLRNARIGRLYRLTVYVSNTLVRDLIPVRVGQTGYMYDRVTKRLFGNKGTGSFVLGPDVAKPVMGLWGMKQITYVPSDYVTDGIVAWYDGEWNAGWNKHDANAQTWKDLSGEGNDATIVKRDTFGRSFTFDSNSCTMDGTFCWSFTASNSVINAVKGDFTIEIIRRLGTPSQQDSTPFFGLNIYNSRAMSMSGASNNCKLRMGMNNEFQAINQGIPGISITISKHIDGSNITVMFYEKGIFKTTQSRTVQAITVTSYGVLFGEGTNLFGGNGKYWQPSPSSDGHAYTLRFYNRALSAAEIAHNYQIDKARFNLQ